VIPSNPSDLKLRDSTSSGSIGAIPIVKPWPARQTAPVLTKNRLEALSDGVLAIAITLLAIEIRPPEVGESESLFEALRHEWPSYAGYAVSFAVLGVIWLNHHRVFELVQVVDGPLLLLNLHLLLWAALIPFPTAVVAEYLGDGGRNAETAVALYGLILLATAVAFTLLYTWISHDARLTGQLPDRRQVWRARLQFGLGLFFYVVAVGVALVAPLLALGMHGAMALYYAFDQASGIQADPDPAAPATEPV
jgi:uncharacterized membrane protein